MLFWELSMQYISLTSCAQFWIDTSCPSNPAYVGRKWVILGQNWLIQNYAQTVRDIA